MRLLLDAHVSGPRVGRRLQEAGHDVRAPDQDVGDFPRLLRDWAEAGRSHAGALLVYGIGQHEHEHELVARGVERWLALRPAQGDWRDVAAVVSREPAAPP